MADYPSLDSLLTALPTLAEANRKSLAGHPCTVTLSLSGRPEILLSLDAQGTLHILPAGSAPSDCTLRGTESALLDVACGRCSPAKALFLRRLTLSGDFSVLLRLTALFS